MASLSPEELAALEYRWEFWARPYQLPPPGDWRTWLLLGGRGSGKTRAAAEWVRAEMEVGRRLQMGIVAPTADSLRRICVEGPSGLLSVGPPSDRPQFESSTRRVVYANGGIVHLFSAEEPDRLRGPNLSGLWIDELTSMPSGGAEVWDMAQMALRIPGPLGHAPRAVVTTTPKMQALLKQIIAAPSTTVTRARTSDNASNLDASTLAYLREKYGGTRLGRQEMDAELLADLEGALWNRALIVAALGADRHGYVLADLSGRLSPEQWARRVVEAHHGYKADKIVAEQNFGGAMVESTIRSIDSRVPIKMVVASRGKQIRAEPVASWYEQHRVHHVGEFPALEDQMTGWDPAESGPSPDRVDACVWALTELMGGPGPMRISPEAVAAIANMAPMPGSPAYDRARLYGRRW
jgi:predicted phage terminase large subunit-like protein